jgi:hypothetical protein
VSGRRVGTVNIGKFERIHTLQFSPDGRMLAASLGQGGIHLIETATWRLRAHIHHSSLLNENRDAIAWSPEAQQLAIAATNGGVLILDVRKLGGMGGSFTAETMDRAWAALGGSDSKAAFAAMQSFAAAPDRSIPLLKSKIPPVPVPDAMKLKALIDDLDSDEFRKRELAAENLAKLGRVASAARKNASPEVVSRIGGLLDQLAMGKMTAEEIRDVRAVEAVEWILTMEAVKLLELWATGAEGAQLTTEAKAALGRLKKRK